MSGSEALTLRTVRSPSRPWESVLMLKASDPSPSRMLFNIAVSLRLEVGGKYLPCSSLLFQEYVPPSS